VSAWQRPTALQNVNGNGKPDRKRVVQKRPASTLKDDSRAGPIGRAASAPAAAAAGSGGRGSGGGTAAGGASAEAGANGGSGNGGAKKKGGKPRAKEPTSKPAAAAPSSTAAAPAAGDTCFAADGSDDEFERPQQRGLKRSAAPGSNAAQGNLQAGLNLGARKTGSKAGSGGTNPGKEAGDKPKKARTKLKQPSQDKGAPAPQETLYLQPMPPQQPQQDAATSGRKKARKASKAGTAADVASAEGAEELKFLAAGAVEACSTLGFQRFAAEMDNIPSCRQAYPRIAVAKCCRVRGSMPG